MMNLDTTPLEEFRRLPLVIEGESKEVRYAGDGKVVIYFKSTIYSFTHNRCAEVPGSAELRLKASKLFLEPLRAAGVRHAYREVGNRYVYADLVLPHRYEFDKYGIEPFVPPDLTDDEIAELPKAPPIEIIVKRFLTGTTKHGCIGLAGSRVRASHPAYAGRPLVGDSALPEMIVRFDWRNPLKNPKQLARIVGQAEKRVDDFTDRVEEQLRQMPDGQAYSAWLRQNRGNAIARAQYGNVLAYAAEHVFGLDRVADQALPLQIADLFIDVEKATRTAFISGLALESYLADHDIIFCDLCEFIAEDGELLYGEISQDCGRYRHVDLGELDKDAWRAGGSSDQVLKKWQTLLTLQERGPERAKEWLLAAEYERIRKEVRP
ncbi:hypothetical protein ACFL26_01370 [Patescibacteria group bacterium]